MKKLWNNYSYAILLIGFSFLFTFIWANHPTTAIEDDYVTITINKGDTLWTLASEYADEQGLSHKEFINWVKKTNNIGETIYAGDTIILPVKKAELFIASSD